MKYLLFILFGLLLNVSVSSQEVIYEDKRYNENIKSVTFNHLNIPLSFPYIDLGSPGKLKLEFDDMAGGFTDYTYEILHCDKDWQQSDLDEMQFLDGFNGETIIDIQLSTNGYSNYTHYELILPNRDVNWTISGNYVLIIRDEDSEEIVLTRRFVVAETLIQVNSELYNPPKNVLKYRTHHELNLKLNMDDLHISRPVQEIFVSVVQNGDWHNAQTNFTPDYSQGGDIFFNRMDKISFPAMREFRNFDTRAIDYTTLNVHTIEKLDNETNVLLNLNRPRVNGSYLFEPDANGQFLIDNDRFPDEDVASEYTNVIFTLEKDFPYEEEVYVTGAFCDWRPSDETKMDYDSERRIYVASIPLKQGYYDYNFALLEDGKLNHSPIEGDRFETENSYWFIVYYREFGSLYDRVIGLDVKGRL